MFLDARSEEILGHYYYLKGENLNTFAQLKRADQLFQLTADFYYRVYNLNMLGTLYLLDNNLTDALITLTRASNLQKEHLPSDTSLYVDIQIDIGLIYFKTQKFSLAKTLYLGLLNYPLSQSQEAQVLNNLAIISIEEGRFQHAVTYLRKAEKAVFNP